MDVLLDDVVDASVERVDIHCEAALTGAETAVCCWHIFVSRTVTVTVGRVEWFVSVSYALCVRAEQNGCRCERAECLERVCVSV